MCRRTVRMIRRLSTIALPGKVLNGVVPRIRCYDERSMVNGARPRRDGKPRARDMHDQPSLTAPAEYIICIPPKKVGMRRPVPEY